MRERDVGEEPESAALTGWELLFLLSLHLAKNDLAVAAQLQAEYNNLQFTLEPIDAELSVMVDRQLLASAVTNLVSNAVKFTHKGEIALVLRSGGAVAETGTAAACSNERLAGLGEMSAGRAVAYSAKEPSQVP